MANGPNIFQMLLVVLLSTQMSKRARATLAVRCEKLLRLCGSEAAADRPVFCGEIEFEN